MKNIFVILLIAIGGSTTHARAQNFVVMPNATCTSSDSTFCSVASALAGARSGDQIEIRSGIYRESLIIDKDVQITGTSANEVIIDAENKDCVVKIKPAITVGLRRLSLRNGRCENGGGIYNQGQTQLNDVIIEKNTALASGGGVYNAASATGSMAMEYTVIRENIALGDDELNVRYGGGGIYNDAPLILNETRIYKNRSSENGGGIYSIFAGRRSATTEQIFAEQFGLPTNNSSINYKTLAREATVDSVLITLSEIVENESDNGGGIYIRGVANIRKSLIENNRAILHRISEGGGIYVHLDSYFVLRDSVVTGNEAILHGGGLRFYSTRYGLISGSTIYANTVANIGNAAGIYAIRYGKELHLEQSVLIRNAIKNNSRASNCGGRLVSDGRNFLEEPRDCGVELKIDDYEYQNAPVRKRK